MAAISSETIVECPTGGQHNSQKEAVSEMGLESTESKAQDFLAIDMPPSVCTPTPEQVSIFNSSSAVVGTLSMEEVAVLALGDSPSERPMVTINRSASLPDNPSQALIPNGIGENQPIYCSRSVPMIYTDVTMIEDNVSVLRVVPNRRSTERISGLISPVTAIINGGEDQDTITKEAAVCRICYEPLDELHNFRLDCNCRGDLALVHRDCSRRWFNIRGTRTCEICNMRVQNVTVRISRRITRAINTSILDQFVQPPVELEYIDIIWQRFLILLICSMMAYTVSIMLLMLRRPKENIAELYGPLFASLVVSVVTSVVAAVFGEWKYAWIYALAQYAVFTVFAEFFFDLCRLGPIPTVILSAFFAVGIGRGAELVYRAIKKWIETRLNDVNNNAQDDALPIEVQPTEETDVSHRSSDANNHESSNETDETLQSDAKLREPSDETDESLQSDANDHETTGETQMVE